MCLRYLIAVILVVCQCICCAVCEDQNVKDASPSDLIPSTPRSPFQGYEVGDPQNCPQTNVNIAEVLPGTGWDNLANKAMGHVLAYNYSNCKVLEDRSSLLPDNIYAEALKKSNVETYSQLITHFSNFTSVTSDSINVGAHKSFLSFGSISGSFSRDYQKTKQHIAGDKSTASRVQLRYEMYTFRSEKDAQLHPSFKNRLLDIASALQSGDNASATFLAQLLVRDYGSHYVTSVTAGAGLVRTDHLSSSYINSMQSDTTTIKASASASFFSFLGFSGSYMHSVTDTEVTKYTKSVIDSNTESFGGPSVKANFSINKWVDEIPNNLVAMDRDGDPLHYCITPRTLPELPLDTVRDVANAVRDAVETYYAHNIYRGCTKVDSPNFNYMANFDDNTCHAAHNNYTFGGVYQTCTGGLCGRTQVNPKTGAFSCPSGYESVLLQQHTTWQCVHKCHHFWFIKHDCYDDCSHSDTSPNAAHYELHWCAATGPVSDNSGYLFGGVYTDKTENPLIQSKDCPPHYTKLTVGWTTEMHFCVSDDYELGFRFAVKFAGLFSCDYGNPLAIFTKSTDSLTTLQSVSATKGQPMSLAAYQFQAGVENWPKTCPSGYSQHLLLVNDGCELNYCVVMNALTPRALPSIRKPPYDNEPKILHNGTKLLVAANEAILVKDRRSGEWVDSGRKTGDEKTLGVLMSQGKLTPASSDSSSSPAGASSSAGSATVTVLAVVLTIALVAVVIFVVFKVVRKVKGSTQHRYINAPDDRESYNTFSDTATGNENV